MKNTKREPMLVLKTGTKGVGRSYFFENNYKDHFVVQTSNKNRQDSSIANRIIDAKNQHEKVCLKTGGLFMRNKYNVRKISQINVAFSIYIEDICNFPSSHKSIRKNIKNKFNLKDTEAYKLIKK